MNIWSWYSEWAFRDLDPPRRKIEEIREMFFSIMGGEYTHISNKEQISQTATLLAVCERKLQSSKGLFRLISLQT